MSGMLFPGSSPDARTRGALSAVLDAAFVVGLGALGMFGFRSIYGGVAFFLVGILGLALGVAVTELAQRWGQPVLAEAFVTLLVFMLLGGAMVAPKGALGGILPTASTLRMLTHVGIYGWKELLTTAPPVGNSAGLLALPYIIGLIGGVAGQSIARRTRSASLPLAGPVLVLALSILFGAQHPAWLAVQGAIFGATSLTWVAARHHRYRSIVAVKRAGHQRLAASIALLGAAGIAGGLVAPALPGSGRNRVVLSRYVVPPFEADQQPSPLSGFRQYVVGGSLNKEVLFSVSGAALPPLVRIATMDEYDGIVWGFGAGALGGPGSSADAFQRYGPSIPSVASGTIDRAVVHVNALKGVWLPQIGQLTRVSFSGPGKGRLTEGFRYDDSTATAAEPGGSAAGDSYAISAVVPKPPNQQQLAKAGPGDVTVAASGVPTVLQTDANVWANGHTGAWDKVMAIADHLRTTGYYSDGPDPGAPGSPVLSAPGHGEGRLTTFLKGGGLVGTDIVGNDEQYAAVLALMANAVGVPARVVLGAQVESSGEVRGSDVHAWVEVSLAGIGWVPIRWDSFVPTRPAHETPPMQQPDAPSSAPVEPPVVSAIHPPLGDQLPGSSTSGASQFTHSHAPGFQIPGWVRTALWIVLPPALVIAAALGAVVGLKRRRRSRRRHASTTAAQIAGAWAELIDQARDVGHAFPAGHTRREHASILTPEASRLASKADAAVFAPGDASDVEVTAFWSETERFGQSLRAGLSRWRQWRALCSLRSLRLAEIGPDPK